MTSTNGPVRVLDSVDQRTVLTGFVAALDGGEPVAVLDPTWPAQLLDDARRQLASAHDHGRLRPEHLAVFTSGSAGLPRGVLRSHTSWRASLDPLTELLVLSSEDVVWTPGPMWSSLSLYGAWHATSVGATTLLAEEDPREATVLHTVPSALHHLTRVAADRGARLKTVVLAGEPVTALHRALCAEAGWRVVEYYGTAELSFVGWSGDGLPWRPFPGVEVELRHGELWARSPYLADGYLDEGPGSLRRDAEGWATVGDRAATVHGGHVVSGRGSSAISTGGHTVAAEHVEAVLATAPGVRDVLVVGHPHAVLGEVVAALVVGDATATALRAAMQRLPASSRPRRWSRVDHLPRTSTGKVDRAGARTAVAEGTIQTGALR